MFFAKVYASSWAWIVVEKTTNSITLLQNFLMSDILWNVIFAIIVFFLTIVTSKISNKKIIEYIERKLEEWSSEVTQTITSMLSRVITFVVWMTWIMIILSILWLEIWLFMWWLWFGIWFTMQIFLSNFIYGVIMVIQWTIKNWDVIEVWWERVTVVNVNTLFTVVKRLDWIIKYIPNINFLSQEVSNVTKVKDVRMGVELIVDYTTDISKLKLIVDKVLKTVPDILSTPAPVIWLQELNNRWVKMQIFFWCEVAKSPFTIKSNFVETLNMAFKQAWIIIPAEQVSIIQRDDFISDRYKKKDIDKN